jgi:hypothetical protein
MHRVYFDSNDSIGDWFLLWTKKGKEDLARIPGGPKEGLVVTIYMIGEIELEATLEWSTKYKVWIARPIDGTVRDNAESWDDHA